MNENKGEISMRKFIKNMTSKLKNQWRNLFDSKEKKMSEGAYQEYKSHPHTARGDNWRRPEQHNNSEKHHNQPPKKSS